MKLQNQIADWIKLKVKEANAKGVVLGLSGGIDSAVVAVLAKEALGLKNVRGLILPCGPDVENIADAQQLVKLLGIDADKTNIAPIVSEFNQRIGFASKEALGNIAARVRMTMLYAHANMMNYLVCGTSNKSEMMIGYFTKYGDGGADIEPIADLYKTEVFELAKELGIPKKIIDKAPSAGLWENQTDEKEIGMAYSTLDTILQSGMISKVKDNTLNAKVRKMIEKSEHKRKMPDIFRRTE